MVEIERGSGESATLQDTRPAASDKAILGCGPRSLPAASPQLAIVPWNGDRSNGDFIARKNFPRYPRMLTQWAAKHSMLAQRRRFALGRIRSSRATSLPEGCMA